MKYRSGELIQLKPYVDYRGEPPVGWSSWVAYWRAKWRMARQIMEGRPWWT